MYKVPVFIGQRCVFRLAFAGVTAALLAGCADSGRVGGTFGDPLGNPFKSASADQAPLPSAGREMAPPPYSSSRYSPSPYSPSPYSPSPYSKVSSTPLAAPSGLPARRVASYEAPAHQSPRIARDYTAPRTERTASIPASSGHGGWSAEGGMTVIAATGENANILGQRYNVPTDALLRANGLTSSSEVRAGTRLVIPVYSANGGGSQRTEHEPAPRRSHDHASRERLLARREPPKPEPRQVAKNEPQSHWVKGPAPAKPAVADKPHGREALSKIERKPVAETKVARHDVKTVETRKVLAKTVDVAPVSVKPVKVVQAVERPVRTAKLEEPEKKVAVDPTPTASLPSASEKTSANGNPEFRWPAHGRIIQGFKSGGNDGINIAVPEGTSVKAAESGVVAYAGSEIKGFGNLVLIRHPNGYVSAYANNGDIEVKRGEQVKRGQTIAKSGQSGNVASPQLHFELRKGSTPVDPTRYLAGM